MKKTCWLLVILFILTAFTSCQSNNLMVEVRNEKSGTKELTYIYENDGYSVTGCTADINNVNIPSEFDDGVHGKAAVTAISELAFDENEYLQTLQLPSSLKRIGYKAFYGCTNLEKIFFYAENYEEPSDDTSFRWFFENCGTAEKGIDFVVGPNCEIIPGNLFSHSEESGPVNIVSLHFMEGSVCTEIGKYAFAGTLLSEVSLPETITNIGMGSFSECKSLKTMFAPGVQKICEKAFYNCTSLENVTLSKYLKDVQCEAFYNTPWYIHKYCHYEGKGTVKEKVIENIPVVLNNGVIYSWDDYSGDFISPKGAKYLSGGNSISTSIFHGVKIELKEGMIGIEDYALNLVSIGEMHIPKSLEYIGKNNFSIVFHEYTIYYAGSEEDWNKIQIAEGNDKLSAAIMVFGK